MTQPQTKLRWWFACCLLISTFSCPPVPAAEPTAANPPHNTGESNWSLLVHETSRRTYYIVSLLDGGSGAHQDARQGGIAWATLDLDTGEKATNLVVTDCKRALC